MLFFILKFSPPDGALQLLSTRLKPLSSLTTYMPIYWKQSESLISLIQHKWSYEEDRSRVICISHPRQCVLVAARLDEAYLVDAPFALKDAPGGGSSMTHDFTHCMHQWDPLFTWFVHLSLPPQVYPLYLLLSYCSTGVPDLGVVGVVLPLTFIFQYCLFKGPVP